jgi:hypothetical protein
MNDARTALRSLLIYGTVIPLALILGYLLANPLEMGTFTMVGAVLVVLLFPLLLRYHYAFMLLAWNMGAYVFFLPGRMNLWVVAIGLSFAVSFSHRILDKSIRFISVPQLTRPWLALAAVVVATAQLRGGFGLRSFGGETVGGKRYILILVAVLGYFALTTIKIPKERVARYVALFLLSGAVGAVAVAYGYLPSFMNFIFLFIPPSFVGTAHGFSLFGILRPLAPAGMAVFSYLLARHGLRKMFTPGHRWLFVLLCGVAGLTLLSGSRLSLIGMAMIFAVQFWLEDLHKTRLLPALGLLVILCAVLVLPFSSKLPISMQRTLAFLPVEVDPIAKESASSSSEWRLEMWRIALPQIPGYLLLGKGYAITQEEMGYMLDQSFAVFSVEERGSFIAGDYHNGPLSVIMPLGIWGVLTYLWVIIAGFKVLWRNYRYGDRDLCAVNTYLLTSYIVGVITFCLIFGSLYSDMVSIAGVLGLSVALNGGVASQEPRQSPERKPPTGSNPSPEPAAAKPRRILSVG